MFWNTCQNTEIELNKIRLIGINETDFIVIINKYWQTIGQVIFCLCLFECIFCQNIDRNIWDYDYKSAYINSLI